MNFKIEKGNEETIIDNAETLLDYIKNGQISRETIVYDIDENNYKKVSDIEEIKHIFLEDKQKNISEAVIYSSQNGVKKKEIEPFLLILGGIIFSILPCFRITPPSTIENKVDYTLGVLTASFLTNIILSIVFWGVAYLIMRKKMQMSKGYLFAILFCGASFASYMI